MKRLLSKKKPNNDRLIADSIYNNAKDWLNSYTSEAANHINKIINKRAYNSIEEFLNDEYDVESCMINTLKNIQDIFDSIFDNFYNDGPDFPRTNDMYEDMVVIVKDIIDNLDKHGYDVKELMTPKLKEELKKIW